MKRNRSLPGIISIIVILTILGFAYDTKTVTTPDSANISQSPLNQLIQDTRDEIQRQADIDQKIIEALDEKLYTFDNPLIVVNPYGNAPLTAIIAFTTDVKTKVSISIQGDNDNDLAFDFNEMQTTHILPVYGLYSETSNTIDLTLIDDTGSEKFKKYQIQTDVLNADLSQNIFNVYKADDYHSDGFNFSYTNIKGSPIKMAIDETGKYRWYLYSNYFSGLNYVTLYDHDGLIVVKEQLILKLNYLGKIQDVYYSPYPLHHDIQVYEDSLLLASENDSPNTIEDYIMKLNLETGKIINALDYKTVLLRSRQYGVNYSKTDWMHMNSIVGIEQDVIVSSNFQSTIIRNDWDGNIKWMLADPTLYPTKFQEYLLKPLGSEFEYPYNQHAVEVLNDLDNNTDTLEIILFDNGSSRNAVNQELQRQIRANKVLEPPLYSRMVIYQINEKEMTVKQLWQYGEDRPELFSSFRGDANMLENGHILGDFNHTYADGSLSSTYVEVNGDGEVVWECWATSKDATNSYQDYRIARISLYNDETNELDLTTPVSDFIDQGLEPNPIVG